jgi:hypothetical protein
MRKFFTYFVSGILPVGLLSISPFIWNSGYGVLENNPPTVFFAGLIIVISAWAISAHHIHLGYRVLENLTKVIMPNRCRVRLVSINLPGVKGISDPITLYYFQKRRSYIFYQKWSPVKNFEIFPDLGKSNSIAYFITKESALGKLEIIQRGRWTKNTQFDPIYIESEYIAA